MKLLALLVSVSSFGCAAHPVQPVTGPPVPPPPPPILCSPPSWEGPSTFAIRCENAIPPKGAEGTVPTPALVNASYATLLAESDYFYITRAELDPVAHVYQLRGVAMRPPAPAPEGALPIFTGQYVQPAEAQAIKLQARETRCQLALGNPAAPVEEQQSCGQFLAWREQARAGQLQQRAYDQMRNDQMAAQAYAEEERRRQRIGQALQGWSDAMAEQQRQRETQQQRQDEERRHQELRRDLRRIQQPIYTPPATTTTHCRPDYAGGIRCTTD